MQQLPKSDDLSSHGSDICCEVIKGLHHAHRRRRGEDADGEALDKVAVACFE